MYPNGDSHDDLRDIHILVVDSDDDDIAILTGFLKSHGAICHVVKNRTEAMGRYVTLFTEKIVPRAIITDWFINQPQSGEYNFYETINRPEANTSKRLIERFKIIDPEVDIIVYTSYVDKVPKEIEAGIVRKGDSLVQVVDILTSSKTITKHRTESNC